MKIKSISFSGSNSSMGPDNSESSNTLSMEPYPDELDDLLDNTTVNETVTLRQYLQLRAEGNDKELEKIHSVYRPDLARGARIVDLNFHLDSGSTVSLNDLRNYQLSGEGYSNFKKLIREKGHVEKTPSEKELKRKPELYDRVIKVDAKVSTKVKTKGE